MGLITKKLIGQLVRGTDSGIGYEGRVVSIGRTALDLPRKLWIWIEEAIDSEGNPSVCCLYEDEITHVNGRPVVR